MSSPDDDNEDLKRALALSLGEGPTSAGLPSNNNEVVNLISDDESEDDEDLRRAIALSLEESELAVKSIQKSSDVTHNASSSLLVEPSTTGKLATTSDPQTITTPAASSSGVLGMDRKAMEEERLARLGKRKRDPSPERSMKQVAKAPKSETAVSHAVSTESSALQYPTGSIKRTCATKYPRTNDITISELLQASSVHTAVLSAFQWDSSWLEEKLNPVNTKQIWIMNAKGSDVQERWRQEMQACGIPNMKLHFPPMNGAIASMHSKFMLLFGKDKLRFVVQTANMERIDWGEVANNWQPGVMENTVFLIDLPRKADGGVGKKEELSSFGKELIYFLEQQQVARNVIDGVLKFDFSAASHLAFVHAIGGVHTTPMARPTGLPGLAKAIHDLGLDNVQNLELDYAAASLGAINDTFLQRLYLAAQGLQFTTSSNVPEVRNHIRIYFPTEETVKSSVGGPDCGGIISLRTQHYQAPTFPRECLRDHVSTRKGMLSHSKLLFARGRKQDGKPFAWVYIGSANISESAWGAQRVLKSGKLGSLTVRNWECGVVMVVPDKAFKDAKLAAGEIPSMSVFEETIEVPFKVPGDVYNGRQPWIRPWVG